MFLNDIDRSASGKLKKINDHLRENYGMELSKNLDYKEIQSAFTQIYNEIEVLKQRGGLIEDSKAITKRVFLLNGLKSLKEDMDRKTPEFRNVINHMVNQVIDNVAIEFTGDVDDFDSIFGDALNNAMKEYRSSKYRFSDDLVYQTVRSEALHGINKQHTADFDNEADYDWSGEGRRSSAKSDIGKDRLRFDPKEPTLVPMDTESGLSLVDQDMVMGKDGRLVPDPFAVRKSEIRGKGTPMLSKDAKMVRDKSGRLVADPFELNKMQMRGKGIMHEDGDLDMVPKKVNKPALAPGKVINPRTGEDVHDPLTAQKEKKREQPTMKESSMHKQLVETEESQAEVMMSAKGFAQELQEMVEKVGRLQNEDLPPVTDRMRQTYGTDSASAFQSQTYAALQGVMDALYAAKSEIDATVESMANTGQVAMHVAMDNDVSDVEIDDFGSAELIDPLGREQRESANYASQMQNKITEMKRLIARAKAIKESRSK